MASKLFNYLFQRTPPKPVRIPNFPYKAAQNPYRAKREWPPDFNTLSQKHKFSFEKRFKRRNQLKFINPTWNKWTKIVQWSLISFVTVYGLFYMRLDYEPFNGRTQYEHAIETFKDRGQGYEKWIREKGARPGAKLTPGEAAEYKRLMDYDAANKPWPRAPT